MNRRSCMMLAAMVAVPVKAASAATANSPIILYCDLAVDPAREGEFLSAYHNSFKPVAKKHEGYVDLTIAKLDKTLQGAAPPRNVNYRFQLAWQSEALRQKWVASAEHVKNWPLLENTLADKNYTVILTHAV